MSRGEKKVWVVAALAFLAISLVLYQDLLPHFATTMVGFGNGDPNQAAWFLAHTAHAIATLSNPFVSSVINVPDGANMLANTSTIAVGALFAPVTLHFGPIVALNLVFILGIAVTAWSYAYVARRWGLSLGAALLVGTLIGFAPIRLIHGQGQPFLVFAIGTPWLLDAVWQLVEGKRARWNGIAHATAWVVWSALVSLERLFILAIPIAIYVLIRLRSLRGTAVCIERIRSLTLWLGATALLLALPLYEFRFGKQALSGPPHDWLMGYSTRIRDFVSPGPWLWWQPFAEAEHPTGFLSGDFVNASYVGVAFFLVFAVAAWSQRGRREVCCMTWASVGALLLSLGPTVAWTKGGTSIPGPYALLQYLPGFSSAHPLNFQIISSISMAMVIGFALDDVWRRRPSLRRVVVAVGLLLVVAYVPQQGFATTHVTLKKWFDSPEGRGVIPNGSVVLTYPYPQNIINTPMLDQAVAGMRYRIIGGQVTVPGPDGSGQSVQPREPRAVFDLFARGYLSPDLLSLYNVSVGPVVPRGDEMTRALRTFVTEYHVHTIVLEYSGSDPNMVVARLNDAFGVGHVRMSDNLIWWNVSRFRS
jgi:hypothetical protein